MHGKTIKHGSMSIKEWVMKKGGRAEKRTSHIKRELRSMSGWGGMEDFSTIGKMGKNCFEKSKRKHVWLELGDALYWDRWAFIVVAVAWVMSHREKERERGLEC